MTVSPGIGATVTPSRDRGFLKTSQFISDGLSLLRGWFDDEPIRARLRDRALQGFELLVGGDGLPGELLREVALLGVHVGEQSRRGQFVAGVCELEQDVGLCVPRAARFPAVGGVRRDVQAVGEVLRGEGSDGAAIDGQVVASLGQVLHRQQVLAQLGQLRDEAEVKPEEDAVVERQALVETCELEAVVRASDVGHRATGRGGPA